MKKRGIVSVAMFGLVFSVAGVSEARGVSTFSGKVAPINYSSAVSGEVKGDRCHSTYCGRSAMERSSDEDASEQETVVGSRSAVRSRLGVTVCRSTFCGPRR